MVVTPEIGSEWTVFRVHVTVLKENGTTVNLNINCQKTKTMFICCEPVTMNVEDQSVDYVDGLCYLGSVVDSFLDSLRWRRGILHDPASRRSNISGNCRQFVPLQSSDYYYSFMAVSPDPMICLINSFATSTYRIITVVETPDQVHSIPCLHQCLSSTLYVV